MARAQPRRRRVHAGALAAAGVSLAAACSFPEPPMSLRNVMLLQEIALQKLERDLEREAHGSLAAHAADVRAFAVHEAFDVYVARPDVQPRAALFSTFRDTYSKAVEGLSAAAEGGDPAAVRAAALKLRTRCDACHATFRPGI